MVAPSVATGARRAPKHAGKTYAGGHDGCRLRSTRHAPRDRCPACHSSSRTRYTMIKRVISVGLFALTAGALWSLNKQLRQTGRQEVPKAKPLPEQRWEGEGGALPVTGAQTGP